MNNSKQFSINFQVLRLAVLVFAAHLAFQASGAPPVVSNIRAGQRPGSQLVDIYYNVTSPNGTLLKVSFAVSANAGTNYSVPVFTYTGAAGAGVAAGLDRLITWNAGTDWGGQFSSQCRVRVVADDGTAPPAPTGMAYIPGGAFQMGDNFNEGAINELPVHNVYISPFFMDKFEVTRELWLDVYSWSQANGYSLNNSGTSDGPNHPVRSVIWNEAVKWCNARSEKAGLTPCYYTDPTQTIVYRSGELPLTNACVKWSANGFRLPTEAEWEKAARGGAASRRYPWGDTINNSQANSVSSGDPFDNSTTPVGYYNGSQTPAGTNMANAYGLYDMAGNVFEFCWDWWDANRYGTQEAGNDDSRGPATARTQRTERGGSGFHYVNTLRCAARGIADPYNAVAYTGFRCARGL